MFMDVKYNDGIKAVSWPMPISLYCTVKRNFYTIPL